MESISVEDLRDKADSLYRLVIVAARRANQLTKSESHALGGVRAKKPTVAALEEVVNGKLGYLTPGEEDDTDLIE
ncbi:MAG TPA: DNA-directed RNA polymerase subunit omega [Candidatus Hydrogenedentes bacterium]|nr:DNA-directed RNA polymerase subunit omega [Candidatus Hydrogenedentota bacterium]HPG66405.1 DNA-directed RNA polymerase subunit omega [Candidatus Hydrogenedentota bacterium]